jgi:hypothetical protein
MRRRRLLIALGVAIMTVMQATPALADVTLGLVAQYPLNGNANDASGNGNNGTVVGADPAPDRFGTPAGAYLFGNNPTHGAQATDYVEIADSASLRPQNGITLSAWINTANSAGRAIVGKQFGDGLEDSYLLWYNVGTLWFTLFPFGSSGLSAPIPSLGVWHHVVGTWDGATMRLYVDGAEVASRAFAGPNQYDSSPVVIGADNDNADNLPDDGWDGLIDDVRIYNRALTQDEIRELALGCTLELTPSFAAGTLNLSFTLGSLAPATWNLWAVVDSTTFKLWSVPIPVIDPAAAFAVPIPGLPPLGVIGLLTTTTGASGIQCSDWDTVDTGR